MSLRCGPSAAFTALTWPFSRTRRAWRARLPHLPRRRTFRSGTPEDSYGTAVHGFTRW
ncbi:hypothetical protein [Streptomyces sp. NPDC058412]|uniref:hypothetical protein n=1 Tax=Streptomyces sp. NPDC058412 TaxID=3346486 RepID=UPI00365ECD4A